MSEPPAADMLHPLDPTLNAAGSDLAFAETKDPVRRMRACRKPLIRVELSGFEPLIP